MPAVQSNYSESIPDQVAGMVANSQNADIDSCVVEGDDAIKFGYAVQQGTAWNQAKEGMAANKFRGVSVKDPTRAPDDNDTYTKGKHMSVLRRGDIWVPVAKAVAIGDPVSAIGTGDDVGMFSTGTTSPAALAIAGCRWMTAAAAKGDLALLRVGDGAIRA